MALRLKTKSPVGMCVQVSGHISLRWALFFCWVFTLDTRTGKLDKKSRAVL